MGFKVMYKGLEVICDTFEDLDFLAEQASGRTTTQPRRTKTAEAVEPSAPETNGASHDQHMMKFINSLPDGTMEVLSQLVANGEMTDSQLRAKLGLTNNMQLAGRTAMVSRSAKKFGVAPEDLLVAKMISKKPGNRKYTYHVPEGAKSLIRRRTHGSG